MTETGTTYGGVTPDDFLRHLRSDTDRILDVTATGDLDVDVPLCPGWTVRDAVEHTGSVFSHKVAAITGGRPRDPSAWSHGPGRRAGPADLVPGAARPARSTSWSSAARTRRPGPGTRPTSTSSFWYRRMAQEAAVHRVDVESGYDAVSPVDDELAVDGIDEVLDWFLSYQAEDVGNDAAGRGTVAVRTGDHIWRLTLTADAVESRASPARPTPW